MNTSEHWLEASLKLTNSSRPVAVLSHLEKPVMLACLPAKGEEMMRKLVVVGAGKWSAAVLPSWQNHQRRGSAEVVGGGGCEVMADGMIAYC